MFQKHFVFFYLGNSINSFKSTFYRFSANLYRYFLYGCSSDPMTTEEISEVLNAAVIKNRLVCIQKEERNAEGYYPDDIIGKILGSDELGIYVGKDKIHYDEIRHIEFYQDNKWSRLE